MADGLSINLDLVKAGEDLVAAVKSGVAAAQRSCVIEVDNQLPVPLILDSSGHDHGGFGDRLPKGIIDPMNFDIFNSRSAGVLTGTEGHVSYWFNNDRRVFAHWDNPWAGSNSADAHIDPVDWRSRVITITGTGNNGAHMRYVLYPVPEQAGWRFCAKCELLYYDGFPAFKGVCPAGGPHELQESFDYHLAHDAPSAQGTPEQSNWRFCAKCAALFYDGFSTFKGRCPAGGLHEQQGSFDYQLAHDAPSAQGQSNWRFCFKCAGLFYDGFSTKGVCPAGGGHQQQGSFDYELKV